MNDRSKRNYTDDIERVTQLACLHWGLSFSDLVSAERGRKLVHARRFISYVLHDVYSIPYTIIARHFRRASHTAALHQAARYRSMIAERDLDSDIMKKVRRSDRREKAR